MSLQVKTRVAGRIHTLTVRDVKLTEAGEVKLTATDFQTSAQLIVRGRVLTHEASGEHRHCSAPTHVFVFRTTSGVHQTFGGPDCGGGGHCHAGV